MKQFTLYKVKLGKLQVWKDWCTKLMSVHKKQAALTLVEENLENEMCVFFGKGNQTYVLYRHVTMKGKERKKANMRRKLNKEHFKKFYECLAACPPRVLGYDVYAKDL